MGFIFCMGVKFWHFKYGGCSGSNFGNFNMRGQILAIFQNGKICPIRSSRKCNHFVCGCLNNWKNFIPLPFFKYNIPIPECKTVCLQFLKMISMLGSASKTKHTQTNLKIMYLHLNWILKSKTSTGGRYPHILVNVLGSKGSFRNVIKITF